MRSRRWYEHYHKFHKPLWDNAQAGQMRLLPAPFYPASLLVNSLKGLVGFGTALAVLHLAAARISSGWALAIALSVAVGWNCALLFARRRAPG